MEHSAQWWPLADFTPERRGRGRDQAPLEKRQPPRGALPGQVRNGKQHRDTDRQTLRSVPGVRSESVDISPSRAPGFAPQPARPSHRPSGENAGLLHPEAAAFTSEPQNPHCSAGEEEPDRRTHTRTHARMHTHRILPRRSPLVNRLPAHTTPN